MEKIKINVLCSITFFPKIVPSKRQCGNYRRAGQATDDSMAHAHCMLDT